MRPVNVDAIGAYIREQREQAKISLRQLAQAAGVSNPYLSQVERGLRKPSADILQQIARGLRISAEALYEQAGIFDDKEDGSSTTEAILADKEINDRQKQMLLDIYESFRKEVRAEAAARAAEHPAAADPGPAHPDPEADTDAVAEAVAEAGNDPIVEVVAAAEAEPWADPPAPATR